MQFFFSTSHVLVPSSCSHTTRARYSILLWEWKKKKKKRRSEQKITRRRRHENYCFRGSEYRVHLCQAECGLTIGSRDEAHSADGFLFNDPTVKVRRLYRKRIFLLRFLDYIKSIEKKNYINMYVYIHVYVHMPIYLSCNNSSAGKNSCCSVLQTLRAVCRSNQEVVTFPRFRRFRFCAPRGLQRVLVPFRVFKIFFFNLYFPRYRLDDR